MKKGKKGVYRKGKIHTYNPVVHALTGGNWKDGWSGTKSFGGHTTYDYTPTLDWWATDNQEVRFELEDGNVRIISLGKVLTPDEADRYCKSF